MVPLRNVLLGVVLLAGLIAAGFVTALSKVPSPLPDVALGSQALLHFERAAAIFAVILLALVVLYQGFRGRLPSELSGQGLVYADVRDEAAEGIEAVVTAVAELRTRVDQLEAAG